MSNNNQHLEHLAEIRALMERSTRFLSLSGLSGVWAGVCALVGAAAVYAYLEIPIFAVLGGSFYFDVAISTNKWGMDYESVFVLIAVLVLAAALAGGWFFTARKARLRGERVWDATSRRLLLALAIPLAAGGVFCLALLYRGYLSLLAPCTLIFYGLALVNGGKFTLRDVETLGILQIILGLLGVVYPGYGLEIWALGFGFLHIFYGLWMYYKYDKK
jgi:predicted lysophospholipase L1 biosynthesis ABC-type transport system permease subunit